MSFNISYSGKAHGASIDAPSHLEDMDARAKQALEEALDSTEYILTKLGDTQVEVKIDGHIQENEGQAGDSINIKIISLAPALQVDKSAEVDGDPDQAEQPLGGEESKPQQPPVGAKSVVGDTTEARAAAKDQMDTAREQRSATGIDGGGGSNAGA